MRKFAERYGFARSAVSLANWREQPYSRWSFQHVGEIVPSAVVPAGSCRRPGQACAPLDDRTICLERGDERLHGFLAASGTNIFAVSWPNGETLRWVSPTADAELPHIVFSVSKSVTGLLAGILADRGELDPRRAVSHYLPGMRASAYGDCPVRHVLDMRVGLDFKEDYLDTSGDYGRYRRAMAWNPHPVGAPREGLVDVLESLRRANGVHGGAFHYQSPNADVAALLVESVAGTSCAEAMSDLLWKPMGATRDAFITVDPYGAPRGSGGISVCAEDLIDLGRLMLEGGTRDGRQVIPHRWLEDVFRGGDEAAWRNGDFAAFLPGGSYRDFWYRTAAGAVLAIGIHGQWLFVNPASGAVAVRLASQPIPQDDALDAQVLRVLEQVTA